MSDDATHELQVAIVSRLKADADVSALIAGRVYDVVPAGSDGSAIFPYVSFGPTQDLPEDFDCVDASEIIIQLDVWSRDPGFREARRISKSVCASLDGAELSINDNALVYFEYDGRRDLRDPDGLTSHSVLTFRAGVENT
jgi:hypothetical protein